MCVCVCVCVVCVLCINPASPDIPQTQEVRLGNEAAKDCGDGPCNAPLTPGIQYTMRMDVVDTSGNEFIADMINVTTGENKLYCIYTVFILFHNMCIVLMHPQQLKSQLLPHHQRKLWQLLSLWPF